MTVSIPTWAVRRRLILLVAFLAAPLVLMSVPYFDDWRQSRTVTHGARIDPPQPVAAGRFTTLDGSPLGFSALNGKWTLLYFDAAECVDSCTVQLSKMRQAVTALGREADRVQRVFVVTDAKALDLLRYTLRDYPGMRALTGPATEVGRLARRVVGHNREAGIYLMDPQGNVILYFRPETDADGLRTDLARLPRVSQVR